MMKTLISWFSKREEPDTRSYADWVLGHGASTSSGVAISWDQALRVSTAICCARVISEGISQVPLRLYRDKGDNGREIVKDHAASRLLVRRPNSWQTPFQFKRTIIMSAVISGNGYAYINRVAGEPRELIPLTPCGVTVEQKRNFDLVYKIAQDDGKEREVPARDMLHLRGPSWDAKVGLDLSAIAAEALGLAVATERTHAMLHGNGGKPSGILNIEGKLSPDGRAKLAKQWRDAFSGDSRHGVAVLDGAAKFTALSMTGVDQQHIETRRYQVEEVCRFFRVFPQMVMAGDKTATYASAEQFFIAHAVHTLQPWAVELEQAIEHALLDPARDAEIYAKVELKGLMRGDAAARAEFYQKAIYAGWMTRNEVRALEEMSPVDGLSEPLVPVNMTTPAGLDRIAARRGDTETQEQVS